MKLIMCSTLFKCVETIRVRIQRESIVNCTQFSSDYFFEKHLFASAMNLY